MPKTRRIFLPLLTLFSTLAAAQQAVLSNDKEFLNDYVSHYWTSSDGLPGNTITDIIQDAEGYINIGTYGGLVKFDGINFTVYNRVTDPRYDFISARSLFLDSNGNMWVGANDEGITCILDGGRSTVTYTRADGLPGDSVRSICEDRDKNIWVGTSSGLAYITQDGSIVIPPGLKEYEGDTPSITKLFCDSTGRVWIATSRAGGLYYSQNGKLTRYEGLKSFPNAYVTAITQEKNGALWFGIMPHFAVRIADGTEKVYDLGVSSQSGTIVDTIYQDSDSQVWFALDTGVVILHDGVLTPYTLEDGLRDKNINQLIQDREGNIWLGTDRGGIQKLTRSKFTTVPLTTSVNAIAEDAAQNLVWLGTDSGLLCYDTMLKPVHNRWTEYCSNVRVRDVGIASDGSLLVSTYSDLGQLKLSPDGSMTSWKDELTGEKVRVALEAQNGDLYIGTTSGLNVIDHETQKLSRIYTRSNGLANEYIMALFEDDDGNIWCGTDGGGVFILNSNGSLVRTLTKEDDNLAGNVIFKITQLSNRGEIWISTGSGISRFKDGEIFSFTSANFIGTYEVFQIIEDFGGTAWMTSNNGISSVRLSVLDDFADGKSTQINMKYFTQSDGIRSGGTTATSRSMKDHAGRLWFTLIDGFAVYDPVKITGNSIPPSVAITEINLDGQKFDYKLISSEGIIMEPGTQRLSINFTGLSFTSPEQVQFSFKLDGFDQEFSEWSTTRTVSYTNLKPGTYTFNVLARTGDEVKSEVLHSAVIVKKPYIWQLWYFWTTLVTLIIISISLIILSRFRRMKLYQATLEKTVQERTEDLRETNHALEIEKGKSESLLLKIFPKEVARTLTETPDAVIANRYPAATVLFADIVGFTKLSSTLDADSIVKILNELFSKFDERARISGIEKIKTIGDSYMAACGLSVTQDNTREEACRMIEFAEGLLEDVDDFNRAHSFSIQIRIGINTGELVAGVIGKTKFLYDIWGDTVNVASRMESNGKPGTVHVTEETFMLTKEKFRYSEETVIDVKGKGTMKTYFIEQS